MKKSVGLKLLCLLTVVFSCEPAKFIPDPVQPRLTKYTAKAYNTVSAKVNGEIWYGRKGCLSDRCNIIDVTRRTDSSQLIITIEGHTITGDISSYSDISFHLGSSDMATETGMLALNGSIFSLDGEPYYAMIGHGGCPSRKGQLYIREVWEEDSARYAMAGTFGFIIEKDTCRRVEVFQGRFDSEIYFRGF